MEGYISTPESRSTDTIVEKEGTNSHDVEKRDDIMEKGAAKSLTTKMEEQHATKCSNSSKAKSKKARAPKNISKSIELNLEIKGRVDVPHLKTWLAHFLDKKAQFEIMDTRQHGNEKGNVVLAFDTRGKAKRALYLFNHTASDCGMKAALPSRTRVTEDELAAYKCFAWKELARRSEDVIVTHESKIEEVALNLKELPTKKRLSLHDFGRVDGQRKALDSKKAELEMQLDEFRTSMMEIKEALTKIAIDTEDSIEQTALDLENKFITELENLRAALPMFARRRDIIKVVQENQVSVILGETGSGKSTQITQYLHHAGLTKSGIIVCTQPRKVAAITLATRVAHEMRSKVGELVGYQVGMQSRRGKSTKIMYMTDHFLLNDILKDPTLAKYSCVIIDEAHERSLYTDLLLGMIKQCLRERKDLKVIITSATIDPDVFVRYFGGCPVLRVSGRMFPVEVEWAAEDEDIDLKNYVENAVLKSVQIHLREPEGDILVFLTTPQETERACDIMAYTAKSKECGNILSMPLHGRLQAAEQQAVFQEAPPGKRKIIFATNSAETSVTIPGIKHVVDTGLVKEKRFDPKKNMSSLVVTLINKSSAEQRKGRAGRMDSGKCYRLYSKSEYNDMESGGTPEILRINLGQALLVLMELGISDPLKFDFVQSPSREALEKGFENLIDLGAIVLEETLSGENDTTPLSSLRIGNTDVPADGEPKKYFSLPNATSSKTRKNTSSTDGLDEGRRFVLTPLGARLAKFPVEPSLGKLILCGIEKDLGMEALVVAALCTSGSNIFYRGGSDEDKEKSDKLKIRFCHTSGDMLTLLNVYREWHDVEEKRKTAWCMSNSINAKSMRITRETIKDLLDILAREKIKVAHSFQPVVEVEKSLAQIILSCYPGNLCLFSGHEKAGYFHLALDQVVAPHPSSALSFVGNYPKWVVYEKLLHTSQDFMTNITCLKDEWVQSFAQESRVPIDEQQWSQKVVSPTSVASVGPEVLRRFKGPRYTKLKSLEDEITNKCRSPSIVHVSRANGEIKVYCPARCHTEINQYVLRVVDDLRRDLKNEVQEIPLNKTSGGVRLLVQEGAEIKDVLMPNEYRSIILQNVPSDYTQESVREVFSAFGEVEGCIPFRNAKGNTWGKVIFREVHSARDAVSCTDKVSIKAKPDGKISNNVGSEFRVKISWCRRPLRGLAFIAVEDPQPNLTGACVQVGGVECRIQTSHKDFADYMIRFIQGDFTEEDIDEQINTAFQTEGVPITKLSMPRRDVGETSDAEVAEMQRHLQAFIKRNLTKGNVSVQVMPPRSVRDYHMLAFASFTDSEEGMEVTYRINGEDFRGRRLTVTPILKTSVLIPKDIYDFLKPTILSVVDDISAELKQLRSKNYVVDIKAENLRDLQNYKNKMQKVVKGSDLQLATMLEFRHLSSPKGNMFLQQVMNKTKTYIKKDYHIRSVHIYGSTRDIGSARSRIVDYFAKLEKSDMKEFNLKDETRSPGLMRAVIVKYGIELKQLSIAAEVDAVQLLLRDHVLQVWGADDGIIKVKDIIDEINLSLPAERPLQQSLTTDCPVCFCPTEGHSYQLEYCGHSYCKECIAGLLQNAITHKEFPLLCASETCGAKIVNRDFQQMLSTDELHALHLSALDAYMAKNEEKLKYCITPNCPVAYKVSDTVDVFTCPECLARICRKCHREYHDSMTCAMVDSMNRDTDYDLTAWLEEDPHNRCRCPRCRAPLEKNKGCNHLRCKCGTHICWLCKKTYRNASNCYDHLSQVHGGFGIDG